ncbi:hypothetical protein ACQE98_09040 [Ornithinimicrobium sp. W1679]|uniref:hypothetical protein n=1 Tax=Ornithinimicrobium sp. W1679 TaxID=3418770 RepID=UPI003CEA42FD
MPLRPLVHPLVRALRAMVMLLLAGATLVACTHEVTTEEVLRGVPLATEEIEGFEVETHAVSRRAEPGPDGQLVSARITRHLRPLEGTTDVGFDRLVQQSVAQGWMPQVEEGVRPYVATRSLPAGPGTLTISLPDEEPADRVVLTVEVGDPADDDAVTSRG